MMLGKAHSFLEMDHRLILKQLEEIEFLIDNLLVRIHLIIDMMLVNRPSSLEFELPFPGSLISTFLGRNIAPEPESVGRGGRGRAEKARGGQDSTGETRGCSTPSRTPKKRNPKHETRNHQPSTRNLDLQPWNMDC